MIKDAPPWAIAMTLSNFEIGYYCLIAKFARFLYLTPNISSKFVEMNEKIRWGNS